MAQTATQRDVTRIQRLAETILEYADTVEGSPLTVGDRDRVVEIANLASDIDARTGRRDPGVRKSAKRKRVKA